MDRAPMYRLGWLLWASVALVGCASPYHTDQNALVGGLGGAGVGAIVGHAVGNTAAGAVIGGAAGALGGAAIGASQDEMEARHSAELAAVAARQQAPAGAVTVEEVVSMVRSGVNEDLVINQVRTRGLVRPIQSADLIALQNQGVSPTVIKAMQEAPTPRPTTDAVIVQPTAPAVIVEEYPYYGPYWGPPYHYYHHPHPGPRVGWGVTFHN